MRILSMAAAFAVALAVPMLIVPPASAADHQSTGAQADQRTNVKAKKPTPKRQQIIRAESGRQ